MNLVLHIGTATLRCTIGDDSVELPVGLDDLGRMLSRHRAPAPEDLTNVIGRVTDELDDLVRMMPDALAAPVTVSGAWAEAIATVDAGAPASPPATIGRGDAEDLFRTVATESPDERAKNPGLPSDRVHDIVAAMCVVVAAMRVLRLDRVTLAW